MDWFAKVVEHYDIIVEEDCAPVVARAFAAFDSGPITPRMKFNQTRPKVFFSCLVPWIDAVLDQAKGGPIVDMGCGDNFLKPFIPTIHGVDDTRHADTRSFLYDFVSNYGGPHFAGAIAINSLHFGELDMVLHAIATLQGVVSKDGLMFITVNTDLSVPSYKGSYADKFAYLAGAFRNFFDVVKLEDAGEHVEPQMNGNLRMLIRA